MTEPGGIAGGPPTPHADTLRRESDRIGALYLKVKGEGAIEPVFVVTVLRDGRNAIEWGERPEVGEWLDDADPDAASRLDAPEPGCELTVVVGGPDGGWSVFHSVAPLWPGVPPAPRGREARDR